MGRFIHFIGKKLLAVLFVCGAFAFVNPEVENVLVISSYHPGFPTFFEQMEGIKSVFDQNNIHFDVEFMDSKRFPEEENLSLFHKNLSYKLRHLSKYDAILTCDDNALRYALTHQDSLFFHTPIVFCGVNDVELAKKQNANRWVSGVIESISMKETLGLMIELFPHSEEIYALADNTSSGKSDLETYYACTDSLDGKVLKEINTSTMSFAGLKKNLQEIPVGTPVLLLSAYMDKQEEKLGFEKSLKLITENLEAPLFHLWNHGMGDGILGGKIISQNEQAKSAANMLHKIFSGYPVDKMEVLHRSPNVYVFDYNELEKYDISGDQLPKASIILNQPQSFYARNKKILLPILYLFSFLIIFIVLLLLTIKKQKTVEIKLQMAMKKAQENDKLKTAFLANMSHEIRTPMNSILGFIDLLESPDLSTEEKNCYSDIISQSGERLLTTINDIIDYSKIEAGDIPLKVESFSLQEMFDYYLKFFGAMANKKNVKLRLDAPGKGDDLLIEADRNKIDAILTNLINNAIKFTSHGEVCFGYQLDKGLFTCFVRDTGVGIAEEKMDLIFERFVQADISTTRGHEGSGLGLAICKAYIEKMNGRIWVESQLGAGSTFHFAIKVKSDIESKMEKEIWVKHTSRQEPEKKEKQVVLVAEDDETSYFYLELMLQKMNFHIIHARNGQEAVEKLLAQPNYEFILMDLKMPVMDGWEATRQIRTFNKEIPIIAQTAFALHSDGKKAMEAGCNAYITKPVKKDKLMHAIQSHIEM